MLWPNGAPGALGGGEGDIPKMYMYPAPGAGVHSAVIVMPGGGYVHLAIEKEGGEEARWLNAHGVTAFVLEYRLGPRYHFPSPMLDGARAMRYVRSNAAELGVAKDRIGLWGFSAGGHLAGYLAAVNDNGAASAEDPVDRVSDPARFRHCFLWPVYDGRLDPQEDEPGGAAGQPSDEGNAGLGLGGQASDEEYLSLLHLLYYGRSAGESTQRDGVLRRSQGSRRARGAAHLRARTARSGNGAGN